MSNGPIMNDEQPSWASWRCHSDILISKKKYPWESNHIPSCRKTMGGGCEDVILCIFFRSSMPLINEMLIKQSQCVFNQKQVLLVIISTLRNKQCLVCRWVFRNKSQM